MLKAPIDDEGGKYIDYLVRLGESVLRSRIESFYGYREEVNSILGIMILVAYWKTNVPYVKEIVPFVNLWCERVGHLYDCLNNIIGFLSTIGRVLINMYGLRWLYRIVNKKDYNKLTDDEIENLSSLLYDIWTNHAIGDSEIEFTYLLNRCVERGNYSAYRLQTEMKENK